MKLTLATHQANAQADTKTKRANCNPFVLIPPFKHWSGLHLLCPPYHPLTKEKKNIRWETFVKHAAFKCCGKNDLETEKQINVLFITPSNKTNITHIKRILLGF